MRILGDRILVEIESKEKVGEIYVPVQTQQENSRLATVINSGTFDWLKIGDKVIINGYTAKIYDVGLGNNTYLVSKEDILCKVEKLGK